MCNYKIIQLYNYISWSLYDCLYNYKFIRLSKNDNYKSVKKYSIITILFVFGLLLVSVVKNETRNLQKKINLLKAEINGIE